MTDSAKPKNTIVVDAVMEEHGDDEVAATVPQSVLENSMFAGKEIDIHPVTKLSYTYDAETFVGICQASGFDEIACDLLKQLVDLNSGYISPALLRAHFGVGYGTCAHIAEELVSNKQASNAPKGRELYLLPPKKRTGGWLKGTDSQHSIWA